MLYRLTDDLLGRAIARRTVLYLAISPLAFVFSAVYAESLFLVLAVGSFLLHRAPAACWSCAVGALARARAAGRDHARAGARLPHLDGRRRARDGPSRAPALAGAAAARGRARLRWATCGGASATRSRRRTPRRAAGDAAPSFPPVAALQHVHRRGAGSATCCGTPSTSASRSLWLGLLVALWKPATQVPLEYAIFAAGVVLLPFFAGTLLSAGRLGMMGFPLFWALAILGRREGVDTAVKILFPPLMAALDVRRLRHTDVHALRRCEPSRRSAAGADRAGGADHLRRRSWRPRCTTPTTGSTRAAPRIGRGGAFTTAPTALAAVRARRWPASCATLWDRLGRPAPFTVCEVGPGDGSLAAGLAGALADLPLDLVLCERAAGARWRASGNACRQRARLRSPSSRPSPARSSRTRCTTPAPPTLLRWPDELARRRRRRRRASAWSRRRGCARRRCGGSSSARSLLRQPASSWRSPRRRPSCRALLAARVARGALFVFDYGEARPAALPAAGAAPAHVPRRPPGRRSARRAGSPGHHRRRRLRGVRAAGESAGLRTVLDEPQPVWLRRHGALERAEALPLGSEERLWLESLARDEASGASFRVLVQERV